MLAALSRRRRSAPITVGGLGLAAALVLIPALPAHAASSDVATPLIYWEGVEDNALTIVDASAILSDVDGLGGGGFGWTEDAFDDYFNSSRVSALGETRDLNFTTVSASYVDDGLTIIEGRAEATFTSGDVFTADARLRIQGSYANWEFNYSNVGSEPLSGFQVELRGNLGSDSDTLYQQTGTGVESFVSWDEFGYDPVIAHRAAATNIVAAYSDGNDDVVYSMTAESTATFYVALVDHNPCAIAAAVASMAALAPDLDETFGQDLPGFYGSDCVVAAESLPEGCEGEAYDGSVVLTEDAALQDTYGDYLTSTDGVSDISATLIDGPAGISVAIEIDPDTGDTLLTVTGTPTEAFSGDLSVRLFRTDGALEDPIDLTVPFTVTGASAPTPPAPPAPPAPQPELAATGASEVAPALGLGFALLVSGAFLINARRHRITG